MDRRPPYEDRNRDYQPRGAGNYRQDADSRPQYQRSRYEDSNRAENRDGGYNRDRGSNFSQQNSYSRSMNEKADFIDNLRKDTP